MKRYLWGSALMVLLITLVFSCTAEASGGAWYDPRDAIILGLGIAVLFLLSVWLVLDSARLHWRGYAKRVENEAKAIQHIASVGRTNLMRAVVAEERLLEAFQLAKHRTPPTALKFDQWCVMLDERIERDADISPPISDTMTTYE